MYDKILVAVDHSEISDRAVLAARDLAVLSRGRFGSCTCGSARWR
jgi:nucleotide-binding universal stress UspA family protein